MSLSRPTRRADDNPDAYLRERCDRSAGLDGCWTWLLSTGSHGYGQAWTGQRMTTAHRIAYEAWVSPIPSGMTVDHLCRNRICINPRHLRLLSNVDNARLNGMAVKTHCLRGHAFDAANTWVNDRGHRYCLACRKINNDRRKVSA